MRRRALWDFMRLTGKRKTRGIREEQVNYKKRHLDGGASVGKEKKEKGRCDESRDYGSVRNTRRKSIRTGNNGK